MIPIYLTLEYYNTTSVAWLHQRMQYSFNPFTLLKHINWEKLNHLFIVEKPLTNWGTAHPVTRHPWHVTPVTCDPCDMWHPWHVTPVTCDTRDMWHGAQSTYHYMRNHSLTEVPHLSRVHVSSPHLPTRFHSFSKKLIYFFFQILSHSAIPNYQNYLTKIWPAPSVPKNSMSPITSPFFAPCIHALKPHAELAIKPSYVAITSLFRSASSATLTSLILRFYTSDSPSSFFKATSLNINKMFYSHKNKPCFLQHKPPSLMTASYPTLTLKSRMSPRKSNNFRLSNLICCKPNDNCNTRGGPPKLLLISSFIAALIPHATASSLPLGSALPAKNTPAHIAGNSRPLATILFIFAILTPSLLSRFSNPLLNHAPIARFPFTKPMDAIKCSARNANAFGLGTPASLKLAVTTLTTCSGCAKIITMACLAILTTSYAVAKLILYSFLPCIALSRPPSLHYLAITTLTLSAPYSLHFHPSLICDITIYINSNNMTAFTSIFTLARLSFQILCLYTNSNKRHDATTYSFSKTKTFYKFYRPSFKPPPTSPSAFNTTFRFYRTPKHLPLHFHYLTHKFNPSPLNCSTSNNSLTTNFLPFTTTSTALLPNDSSYLLTTSNFKHSTITSHFKTSFNSLLSHINLYRPTYLLENNTQHTTTTLLRQRHYYDTITTTTRHDHR